MRNFLILAGLALTIAVPVQGSSLKDFKLNHEHVPGQLIVKFKSDIPDELKDSIVRTVKSDQKNFKSKQVTALLEFPVILSNQGLLDLASSLEALPEVEFVEANNIWKIQEVIPNDTHFDKLYGLYNIDDNGQRSSHDISATLAWDITTGSKDVLVGIIDTGIDYNHPDLAENIWTNPAETGLDEEGNDRATNGIDDDGNGYIDDWRGWDFINEDNDPMDGHSHGTHCAGTIGAKGNNEIGVVGVNWNVSLVGLKVFTDTGSTTTIALANAIHYATSIGVNLTSNSWGGGPPSDTIREAIVEADNAGILFIAAAGNSSSDNDLRPHYPSSYEMENIISVASTNRYGQLSSFSSYGINSVDVAAPGSEIYSTIPNAGYGYKSGTSMATPHVTGLAALVMSKFPDFSHYQIRRRVLATARPNLATVGRVAYGRIDALSSLEIDNIAPSKPSNITVVSSGLTSIGINWTASGDDESVGQASYYDIRISPEMITEETWNQAIRVSVSPETLSESTLKAQLNNLNLNQSGYLAIRAFDNVGNFSGISDNLAFAVQEAVVLVANEGTIDFFETIDSPWDSEDADIDGTNTFVSDSPGGEYDNNLDISVVSESYKANGTEMVFAFDTKYDLEKGYDFGYFDIQVDGGDWTTIATFNGSQDWTTKMFSLQPYLSDGEVFRVRFNLKTDSSVQEDGWGLDNFQILVPKS